MIPYETYSITISEEDATGYTTSTAYTQSVEGSEEYLSVVYSPLFKPPPMKLGKSQRRINEQRYYRKTTRSLIAPKKYAEWRGGR